MSTTTRPGATAREPPARALTCELTAMGNARPWIRVAASMSAAFDTAWRRAYVNQLRALLPGRRPEELDLLPLDETLRALGRDGEIDLGRQEVPVSAIVGSLARAGDFDRDFRPRRTHLRARWDAVAHTDRSLPPVKLVRLNDLYFVADGHHRVSVARARDMSTITADVRRICTIVCANRCLTVADLPEKAAQRSFLQRVPLPEDTRVGLSLTEPAGWTRLADAAEAWGFRQELAGRAIDDRCQLASAWWTEEVLPLVERLRSRGIGVDDTAIQTYLQDLADAHATEG